MSPHGHTTSHQVVFRRVERDISCLLSSREGGGAAPRVGSASCIGREGDSTRQYDHEMLAEVVRSYNTNKCVLKHEVDSPGRA